MGRNQIVLSEQDLHMLVEDAVRIYLQENDMEEGVTGFLGGMFNRGQKQVQNTGENLKNSINNKLTQAKEYGKKKLAQAKQGVQNYQMAGQVSSINQDAQKAVTTAYNSLNNLVNLSNKLKGITGYSALGPQLETAVVNCMNALKSRGNLRNDISGQFAAQRDTAVNPNASFYRK
jgi:hypothetical protein